MELNAEWVDAIAALASVRLARKHPLLINAKPSGCQEMHLRFKQVVSYMLTLGLASCNAKGPAHGDFAALLSTRLSADQEQAVSVYPVLNDLSVALASTLGGRIVETKKLKNADLNQAGFCSVAKGLNAIFLVADIYSNATGVNKAEGIQTFVMDCSTLPGKVRSTYFARTRGKSAGMRETPSDGFGIASRMTAAHFRENQKHGTFKSLGL